MTEARQSRWLGYRAEMHRYLMTLGFVFVASAATSAEVPARFRGIWIGAGAENQKCLASDWKGPGQNDNDALIQITGKSRVEWESGCDVKAVSTPAIPTGSNRMADGPTTLTLFCSGEGETETIRETWDIVRVQGTDVLVASQVGKPRISAWVRCR